MVIFDGKYLNYQWTTDEVPGTYYGMSGKGWMDQELFKHWFQDHFLKYAVPTRPLLLLMDGHSSHYEPSSVELAKNNDVILFCLPPHTTQDSQPLDCTVFGPLKRHWSTVCHEFLHNHPGVVINKYNFSGLFAKAWLLALTPANIVSGFKKCGIYPFNRNAIVIPNRNAIVIPLLTESSREADDSQDDSGSSYDNNTSCDSRDKDSQEDYGSNSDANISDLGSSKNAGSSATPQSMHTPLEFSEEQVAIFTRRYEEGYDVFVDKHYVAWLEINHPAQFHLKIRPVMYLPLSQLGKGLSLLLLV